MASYAETARIPAEAETFDSLQPISGTIIARQVDRVRQLVSMSRIAGPGNAARILCDRIFGTGLALEREFDLDESPAFLHPLTMTTAMSDLNGYKEIARDGVYDLPSELDETIDGKPIVDIGAYIGVSAAYFATRYPKSEVTAIEPSPRNYRLLAANAALYGAQIHSLYGALSLDRNPVGMMNNDSHGLSHMSNVFLPEYAAQEDENAARGITPEDIVSALGSDVRIGILKVDIEGAESRLFGSPLIDPLLDKADLLMIEAHDRFEIGRGSSRAIAEATARSGMAPAGLGNGHTAIYAR